MSVLSLRSRQRTRAIDLRLLRKITTFCLKEIFAQPEFELGIHLVGAKEMAEVNQQFLQHSGSTDVITFDYNENAPELHSAESVYTSSAPTTLTILPSATRQHVLHGEIFICIDDAIAQAKEFGTTWQSELVRYVVHGILHLLGYDDLEPVARKKMKREENRIVGELTECFPLSKLQRRARK
jgi:probable rRNA maturation factor